MRLRHLAALTGLSACSAPSDPPAPQPTETAAPIAPPPAPPLAGSAGLHGEVSPLTSDVSGLNIRVTDYGTVIDLPADALFEFDKADLTPGAAVQLAKTAELIGKAPPGPIQIVGHTDSKGDDAYNLRLSEARAKTVAAWFGQQPGVRQRAYQVSGKGEIAPVAPNETLTGKDDPAGRAKNRRVEVVLPKAP